MKYYPWQGISYCLSALACNPAYLHRAHPSLFHTPTWIFSSFSTHFQQYWPLTTILIRQNNSLNISETTHFYEFRGWSIQLCLFLSKILHAGGFLVFFILFSALFIAISVWSNEILFLENVPVWRVWACGGKSIRIITEASAVGRRPTIAWYDW